MMEKRGFRLVIFLFFFTILANSVNAGCCINLDTGISSDICKPVNSIEECTQAGAYPNAKYLATSGFTCNDPIYAEVCTKKVCFSCVNPADPSVRPIMLYEYHIPQICENYNLKYGSVYPGLIDYQCTSYNPSAPSSESNVSGFVKENNLFKEGVTVNCGGITTTTSGGGAYRLVNCAPSSSLTITANSGTKTGSTTISLGTGEQKTGVNISLVSTDKVALTIKILNENSAPAYADKIEVNAASYSNSSTSISQVTYDVPKDTDLIISVMKSGYETNYTTIKINTATTITIKLKPSTTSTTIPSTTTESTVVTKQVLELTVLEKGTNKPINLASVQVSPENLMATTDKNGKSNFELNVGSDYSLVISHDDYDTAVFPIKGGLTNYTAELNLVPLITVTGNVINKTGSAISGATIFCNGVTTTTTNSGSFTLTTKKKSSEMICFVNKEGYATKSVNKQITPGTVNFPGIALDKLGCNPSTVSITLSGRQIQNKTSLNWNVQCPPTFIKIYKKQNDAQYNLLNTFDMPPIFLEFIDSEINPGNNYTYYVNFTYVNQNNPLIRTTVQSNSIEIVTGKEYCFNEDRTLCVDNSVVVCKSGQEESKTPCGNSICIEKSKDSAECIQSSKCQMCNRPFGVFSNELFGNTLFGGKGFNVSLLSYRPEMLGSAQGLFYCSGQIDCFKDVSTTIVDKYKSCNEVESCYDYGSEDACRQNTCFKSRSCEWIQPSKYSELGIGVCRPIKSHDQDCEMFNFKKAFGNINNVFANPKEICLLYGDCYYRSPQKDNETGICMNKKDVSCYDYIKEDCVGPENKSVSVDVDWTLPISGSETLYKRSGGTNKITQNSLDLLERNVCKFSEETGLCIRDADNNQERGYYKDYLFQYGNDCAKDEFGVFYKSCALDVKAPITDLRIPDFLNGQSLSSMEYDVADESDIKTTYFKAIKTEEISVSNTYPSANRLIMPSGGDGNYTLFYYSVDGSNNLEEIKQKQITIDNIAPKVDLIKKAYPIGNLGESKLTFAPELRLTGNDVEAYCVNETATGLYLINSAGIPIYVSPTRSTLSAEVLAKIWFESYDNIQSGTYTYVWKCCDRAGNCNTWTKNNIKLDGNLLINSPMPDEAVKERTVNISVQTMFPGECRYCDPDGTISCLPTKSNWNNWISLISSDGESGIQTNHYSTVVLPSQTEFKKYFVGCNLLNIQDIVFGTPNVDDIAITIDDKMPRTQIIDLSVNPSQEISLKEVYWVNGANIKLVCNDTVQRQAGYPRESGCGSVSYCIGDQNCVPVSQNQAEVVPSINETTYLRYYSEDKLGNNESPIKQQLVKFDSTPPIIILETPNVTSPILFQTKSREISIVGKIINTGAQAGIVSPIKEGTSQYVLVSNGAEKRINLTSINADKLSDDVINIIEEGILLGENQDNLFWVETRDLAGNLFTTSKEFRIIQDSKGPDLGTATVSRLTDQGTETQDMNIESGKSLNLIVRNLKDIRSSCTQYPYCVDSVWIEDLFRTKYYLTKGLGEDWTTKISTEKWPVLPAQLKIYANDTLGNIANRSIVTYIKDTTPPVATLKVENKYGEDVNALTKGLNYLVLNASEDLENVTLNFKLSNKEYTTTFTLKDFNSITWIGLINVSDDVNGEAIISGEMYDANGVKGTSFTPNRIMINTAEIVAPSPIINGKIKNNTYYHNQLNLPYNLNSAYKYQFTVNGKIFNSYSSSTNAIIPLEIGTNEVKIRVENSNGNYNSFIQNIFIDLTKPVINTYPNGPYRKSNDISLVFEDAQSGIDNQTTNLNIGNILTNTVSNNRIQFNAELNAGTYSGQAHICDVAGNCIDKSLNVQINPAAPTLQIRPTVLNDLFTLNDKLITSKPNPELNLIFSNLISGADALTVSLSDNLINNRTFTPQLEEGSNELVVNYAGFTWKYEIVLDTMTPEFTINSPIKSNGKPLRATIEVSNEALPIRGTYTIGTKSGQISCPNSASCFIKDIVDVPDGATTMSVTLIDSVGKTSTKSVPITIKKTISELNTSEIDYDQAVKLIEGKLTSNQQTISLAGKYLSDITKIYVIGEDEKQYIASDMNLGNYNIRNPRVKLVGRTFEEINNNLKMIFEDDSGNQNIQTIQILKDLKPPYLKSLAFLLE